MMTVERIAITVCVSILGSIIFTSADGLAVTMSRYFAVQFIAPVAVMIAFIYDAMSKKQAAKNV